MTHHFLVGWLTVAFLSGAAIVSPGPNAWSGGQDKRLVEGVLSEVRRPGRLTIT